MNKKNLITIFLTAVGIITVPLLVFAWYLLPPEITLPRLETLLVYQGVSSGQYSDSVELKAFLSEKQSKKAIAGREIEFILEEQKISAITNANGIASAFFRLNQTAKNYTILSIFAGDEQYHGSSDSNPFEILKEDTTLTYTGPLSGAQNSIIKLSAQLSEIDAEVGDLQGKIIIFNLAGLSVRTATDKQGKARADLELNLSPGTYTLKTEFLGNGVYLSSSDTDDFEVKAITKRKRCFIAAASFDSPLASELDILRRFRDEYLLTNQFGVLAVEQYERFSPFLADFIAENENLRKLVRIGLRPIIGILELLI